MISKFRAGYTTYDLALYLQETHNIKVSMRTVTGRLALCGERKNNLLDPYRVALIEFARSGKSYTETQLWLKEQGVHTATRTLKTRMQSWGVNRRPRGETEKELKEKIRLMVERGMAEDEIKNALYDERWFVSLTRIVKLKMELKAEKHKKREEEDEEEDEEEERAEGSSSAMESRNAEGGPRE